MICRQNNIYGYGTFIRTTALVLTSVTVLSFIALTSIHYVSAETTATATASINVSSACTMSSGGGNYNQTVTNGSTTTITANPIVSSCNDHGGFKIYAIGDSDNILGTTDMIASTSSTNNIKTDGSGTYGSYWKMKVDNTTGAGINATIPSGYASYTTIPNEFALVATYNSSTGNSTGSITPSYQIYIADDQPAGTYTGKVRYTLIHPATTPAPKIMQNFLASDAAGLSIGDTMTLLDSRDGTSYLVGKLADGNVWMLENLALDLTNNDVKKAMYSSTDSNYDTKTNADNATLGYLFNGGGGASDQYAKSAVGLNWPPSDFNYVNYTTPRIAINGTCDNAYCVNSPSNGQWSYDAITPVVVNGYTSIAQGKIGIYYDYCAASAGSYCYSGGGSSGDATEDICPSGWHMPTSDSSNGSYQYLFDQYSEVNANPDQITAFQTALSTPLSGSFHSKKGWSQGQAGYFWSSTRDDGSYMRILSLGSDWVYAGITSQARFYGFSIRCVYTP